MNLEIKLALIGAALAALGYVGKLIVEWWQSRNKERAEIVARLQALESLLKASGALFEIQQKQVKKLVQSLMANHPEELRGYEGYEDAMARCHAVMTQNERELHGIVRAYTEFSLRAVNQSISAWCEADKHFKTAVAPTSRRHELAGQLFALEIHLKLWHAKYESWIPGHPEHALVYLDDERAQGLGFPRRDDETGNRGVDAEVSDAVKELLGIWR